MFQKGEKHMDLLKRLTLYGIIILLLISIYKDITIDEVFPMYEDEIIQTNKGFHVLKREIQNGDTVLSVLEEINDIKQLEQINIDQMIKDFKMLNQNVNPYQLQQGKYYLFPKYLNNE